MRRARRGRGGGGGWESGGVRGAPLKAARVDHGQQRVERAKRRVAGKPLSWKLTAEVGVVGRLLAHIGVVHNVLERDGLALRTRPVAQLCGVVLEAREQRRRNHGSASASAAALLKVAGEGELSGPSSTRLVAMHINLQTVISIAKILTLPLTMTTLPDSPSKTPSLFARVGPKSLRCQALRDGGVIRRYLINGIYTAALSNGIYNGAPRRRVI